MDLCGLDSIVEQHASINVNNCLSTNIYSFHLHLLLPLFIIILDVITQNVVMLNLAMLSVMAPCTYLTQQSPMLIYFNLAMLHNLRYLSRLTYCNSVMQEADELP
jgi:hypothetical protein